MPFDKQISDETVDLIYELKDEGLSLRAIAEQVGYSKDTVNYYIKKRVKEQNGELMKQAADEAASKITQPNSVFDVMQGLEICLVETQKLLKYDTSTAPLRDKLAVRSELRQLFREARETLESIYNIRLFNAFIEEVTRVLEAESPGARQRILIQLEKCTLEAGIRGVFDVGGTGPDEPVDGGGQPGELEPEPED